MSKLKLKVKTVFEPERHTVTVTTTNDIFEDIKAMLEDVFEIEMLTTGRIKVGDSRCKMTFDTTKERATKIKQALTETSWQTIELTENGLTNERSILLLQPQYYVLCVRVYGIIHNVG